MKHVVFDIETDNLYPLLTKIHCLVLRDVDTDTVLSCADQPGYTPIAEGLAVLRAADTAYGHNAIDFDMRALRKLFPGYTLLGKLRDTFIIAAMRWAHIKDSDFARVKLGKFPVQFAGRHSLEAWGHRLGHKKGEYTKWCKENGIEDPWAEWRPEMQKYCEDDTAVTRDLVLWIRKYGVSAEAVDTELRLKEYLVKQEENGWPFDMEKAVALQGKLAARREELAALLRAEFGSWTVSLGMFTPKKDNKTRGYQKGVPIERFKTIEFNPASRQHIANRLQVVYGWQPEQFTASGQVEVNETTLKGLDYPAAKLLHEYLLVEKRLGQLSEGKEGWLKHVRLDPRTGLQHIYGRVKQNGAITHRAAHANPNLGQVPKVGSPFGAECRELFHVPKGWVQIGADASGLEARCLGHFVARYDDGVFAKLLLEGDVHTTNQLALELPEGVDAQGKKYRDRAKTWYYAWMFGAGDKKLGKILSPESKESQWAAIGAKARKVFLKNSTALKYLIDAIHKMVKVGWIRGLDDRRVYIRSEHAALNTLIQSSGAIICKKWIVEFDAALTARFGPQGWDGQWAALGWIHDEVQLAVRPEIAEEVKLILVRAIEQLTQHFNFRCPLSGEAKVGNNWKETH